MAGNRNTMATLTPIPGEKPLTPDQERFVEYMLTDPRATWAFARATGRRGPAARQAASRWLKDPRIRERLRRGQEAKKTVTKLKGDNLLRELAAVVTADPRDLIEYRRGACRWCHGAGHRYQRTPAEYERELKAYLDVENIKPDTMKPDRQGLLFDQQGGIGFNPNAKPAPDCPECHGHGVGYTYVKDSRDISAAAARLYAGVKETKDGLEIKIRNPDRALELALRHLGLLDPDKGKGGAVEEKAAAIRELLAAIDATTGGPGDGGAQ